MWDIFKSKYTKNCEKKDKLIEFYETVHKNLISILKSECVNGETLYNTKFGMAASQQMKMLVSCYCYFSSYFETPFFDEEHQIHYQKTVDKFLNAYNRIYDICKNEYRDDFDTDKDAALYILTCTYPHVLFAMRKNQENVMNNLIWKYVKNETKFEEND